MEWIFVYDREHRHRSLECSYCERRICKCLPLTFTWAHLCLFSESACVLCVPDAMPICVVYEWVCACSPCKLLTMPLWSQQCCVCVCDIRHKNPKSSLLYYGKKKQAKKYRARESTKREFMIIDYKRHEHRKAKPKKKVENSFLKVKQNDVNRHLAIRLR